MANPDRALDRATGSRPVAGNAASLLDAPAALAAMRHAIANARHTVHFENYIVTADATGRRFAQLFVDAARRGVMVRIIYDWLGCRGTPLWFWRDLRAAGCHVRAASRPSLAHPLRLLQRDHRKLCVVDGTDAVLGGICIADPWDGEEAWRDVALGVRGPAVRVLDAGFAKAWVAMGGDPITLDGSAAPPAGTAELRIIEGTPGAFRLHRTIEYLAAIAERQIWITDAYFVAPPSLVRALIAAVRDGVDVRLMVPGHSDLPVVRTFTRVGYRELLIAGVRIWEWHGPMLHSKTAVVDGRYVKVGSSNLNPSSLMGNWELDALVDDPTMATEAALAFRRDIGQSVEVILRAPRLTTALPPAVVASARRRKRRPARELPRRAVRTLRQVAGGAQRGLAGAVTFVLVGVGVLSVTLPTVVAYATAAVAFGLAGLAASRGVARWRD